MSNNPQHAQGVLELHRCEAQRRRATQLVIQQLGVVRAVVPAHARRVAADDEMRAPVVLAHQGMEDRIGGAEEVSIQELAERVKQAAGSSSPIIMVPYGEAYPEGLRRAVEHFAGFRKPVYILENGVPDRDDRIRPWVIESTVSQMRTLLAEGVDLRGYFHWTLADNFEWNEGWHLRFGLFELDPATQVRKPRPSAQLYARLIQESLKHGETAGAFMPEMAGANHNGAHLSRTEMTPELTSGMAAENEGSFSE